MRSEFLGLDLVCIHEDRFDNLEGLIIAARSVLNHSPSLRVVISCGSFKELVADRLGSNPNLLYLDVEFGGVGWNVKPLLLEFLLEKGCRQVIWLDSDVVVNSAILDRLMSIALDKLVVAEEPFWGQNQGSKYRTEAWALQPGRELEITVNTGLVRVSQWHIKLIKLWKAMLAHPVYVRCQQLPGLDRPLHMIGDQEALTALLGSRESGDVSIYFLKRGVEIAQCFGAAGYTVFERLRNVFSLRSPDLFHAMGRKPWTRGDVVPSPRRDGLRQYYEYLMLELSPYTIVALPYATRNGPGVSWARRKSTVASFLSVFGLGSANLIGLPLAVIDSSGKFVKRILKIDRFSIDSAHALKNSPFEGMDGVIE